MAEPTHSVARLLAERGPLSDDDIRAHLQRLGAPEESPLVDEILYPVGQLVDDRWVWLPNLLAGRIFTHRVDADELAHDILHITPDLDPVTELCNHPQYQQLTDGSTVQIVFGDEMEVYERDIPLDLIDESGALLLAPGTLAALGVADGELVGLGSTPDGLALTKVSTATPSDVGARLTLLIPEEPEIITAAVWTLCGQDAALFTEPLAPLREIIDDAGLAREDSMLAPAGFDFDSWHFDIECGLLAKYHDLGEDQAFALLTMTRMYELMQTVLTAATDAEFPESDEVQPLFPLGEHADTIGAIGAELADPLLAVLLAEETLLTDGGSAAALGLLAETVEPQVPRSARVAYRWLRALALERLGDVAGAERELLAAESMDPSWPLVLLDLARFAADRGQPERTLGLLRRAQATPDHPLLGLVSKYLPQQRNDIGRNDACWCGSGRKYKKCHLGNEQVALEERADWLYRKACQHVSLTDWIGMLADVADERILPDDDFDPMEDPLVMDALLFEGGAFEDFLAKRGFLLPADEYALAQRWLQVQRSVLEIEQVRSGEGMTVRDLRTGDRHDVRERKASTLVAPGQLLCARVVPAGETMQFFGGLEPVALHERDALITLLDEEPDELTLVARLSRRFAPPTLTNTEGEPVMMCTATVRFADLAALDTTYDRVEGELAEWHEYVPGTKQIRAMVSVEGDTLRVQTNSEERMERVLGVLAELDPALTVLDDVRQPLEDIEDSDEDVEFDPDDPNVVAYLEQFILDYESKWLDEPIPALSGHTPRQAADDPTRRGDLIKLLDSFPADAGAGAMNAQRLREALGLT